MNFTRIFSYFFTPMYPYVSRMYPYVTRMLVVCYSYVSVCSVCYSYVLVLCFSHDPAMLVTRVDISTNGSMSLKDLVRYSITAKVNINQEQ